MAHPRGFASLLQLLLIGAVAYFATGLVLELLLGKDAGVVQDGGDIGPMEFAADILAEEDDYVADIRAAAQFARERWSYAEHRAEISGLDLDAAEAEGLRRLGDTPDEAAFMAALTWFVSQMEDGHSWIKFPNHQLPGPRRWPFALVEVAEGVMVRAVEEGTARPVPGDILLAVDGVDVEEWIAAREDRVFASTDGSRRRQAIRHLAGWDEEVPTRRFRFRGADGAENEVAYFRPGNFSPPPDSGWPGPPEGRDAILAATYAEIDGIIGELAGARALVLDLRGNPGGTDLLGQFLVDRLVAGDYIYFQLAALSGSGWRDFHPLESSAPEGANALRVPTAVLLDEGTFSTADNVAACLEAVHPEAVFVGRPNGAGTGAPRPHELPRTGTTISFCTQRVLNADGRMGEGISVALDRPVTWTREDVLQGRDPDLAAALELLKAD